MKPGITQFLGICFLLSAGCAQNSETFHIDIYETSSGGNKLTKIEASKSLESTSKIVMNPGQKFQEITGFGGAFTESSAYLLNQLSTEKRNEILEAYFGDQGSRYSLTRTHINSCDFSLTNYSYDSVAGDTDLQFFSIEPDRDDIIPMIKEAMEISTEGFKIVSSPWTAPPWMKDNKDWRGGKLLPEYYQTWASYMSRYLEEYKKEGIDIWALTVENEPLGNGSNWESMHYTPQEMNEFVKSNLGPTLQKNGQDVKILAYDQNRGRELEEWAEVIWKDEEAAKYLYGTAVHWYTGTVNWFPESLQFTHDLAPEKHILHTEACVDAEVPHWQEDEWYWSREATDWGYDWAPEEDKDDHPKYVPVYRYARDIIGCLNNWVEGWIDWNMVLDTNGGPNWAKNWCVAPIIVKPETDEVYYTPIYYTLAQFSRFIRPGAIRIGVESTDPELMITAAENQDGSTVLVVLNMTGSEKVFSFQLDGKSAQSRISSSAIQTIIING